MATVRFNTHERYLIVNSAGGMRVLRRLPNLGHDEYAFRLIVRVPNVERPRVAGEVTVELPPGVALDAEPVVDVAGPLEREAADAVD